MEAARFFDSAYGSAERYWWSGEWRYSTDPVAHAGSLVTQLLLRHAARRPPGRALDLGSGEGADAIRLALLGWEVDAVEISGVGAEKIERFAYEAGVEVRVHNGDALTYASSCGYDLIVCNGVLHYVEDKERLIRNMQEMTRPGGCNALSSWSTFTPVPECHRIVPVFPDEENGVITRSYRDWDLLLHYYERNRMEAGHSDMGEHAHSHIKTVATKPR